MQYFIDYIKHILKNIYTNFLNFKNNNNSIFSEKGTTGKQRFSKSSDCDRQKKRRARQRLVLSLSKKARTFNTEYKIMYCSGHLELVESYLKACQTRKTDEKANALAQKLENETISMLDLPMFVVSDKVNNINLAFPITHDSLNGNIKLPFPYKNLYLLNKYFVIYNLTNYVDINLHEGFKLRFEVFCYRSSDSN